MVRGRIPVSICGPSPTFEALESSEQSTLLRIFTGEVMDKIAAYEKLIEDHPLWMEKKGKHPWEASHRALQNEFKRHGMERQSLRHSVSSPGTSPKSDLFGFHKRKLDRAHASNTEMLRILVKREEGLRAAGVPDAYFNKEAMGTVRKVIIGASAATAAVELLRSRGASARRTRLTSILKGEESDKMVDVSKYMKARDKSVVVVDSTKKVDRFVDSLDLSPSKKKFSKIVFNGSISQGNNAFAHVGVGGRSHIIGKGKLPVNVVEHEYGHIQDFRDKSYAMTGTAMGGYVKGRGDSLLQGLSKSRWKKGRYKAETEAWSRVNRDERTDEVRDLALKSYEDGFHQGRAGLALLPAYAALLLG